MRLARWGSSRWARGCTGAGAIIEDERDRFIEQRSSKVAYYVLMAGIIYAGMVLPFTQGGWDIVHAALFAIAAAEIVHGVMIMVGYRRGWHA